MDDSTLDKLFSDNLGEEQQFDYREEDWTEVSDRLEDGGKRRFAWWWVAAAGVLFLSIGLNVWQTCNLQRVNGEIAELQEAVLQQSNNDLVTTAEKENQETTTTEEKIVIQRDTIVKTIYKTVIKEKEVPVYIYRDKKEADIQSLNKTENEQQEILSKTTQSYEDLYAAKAQPLIEDQPIILDRLDLLSATPILPVSMDKVEELEELPVNEDQKIVKPSKYSRWLIGLSSSYARIPMDGCVDQSNWSVGVETNYRLSRNWTLRANYSYNRIKATCLTTGSAFQDPGGINSDYNFAALDNIFLYEQDENQVTESYVVNNTPIRNIQSRQNYLQFSLGAKYNLPKKFYLSTQILGYHNLNRKNIYNAPVNSRRSKNSLDQAPVIPSANGQNDERYSSQGEKSGLIIDRLEVGLGKDFHIKEKWLMPVELYYQRNLNQNNYSLPTLIGLRASFLRKI